jgi:outer membrane autotransporter protein
LEYEFDLSADNTRLLASLSKEPPVPPDPPPDPNPPLPPEPPNPARPQAKALSEAFLSGMALVNQGVDLAAFYAPDPDKGKNVFAILTGGASRYNTGSHIDVNALALMTGVTGAKKLANGDLTFGAFVSYGKGNYSSFNSFSDGTSVHGSGDTDYAGGGILLRHDFNGTEKGHTYAEGSFQAGRVKTDFHSNDLADANGLGAKYEASSAYYGLHLGAGHVWNVSDKATFDLYGKYLYSRRGSDSVTLNTGDPLHFAAIKSQRVRIGGRYAWTGSKVKPYAGLAWEHEFGGEAKATTYDYNIDAPQLKGSSGIAELGVTLQPAKAWTLDLSVQGYTGKREGVSARFSAEYKF